MKRLAKGTSVVYKTKQYSGSYSKDVVPFAKENGYNCFNAFVTGDTPDKGIAIVSLDNPEMCLVHIKKHVDASEIRREIIETGAYIAPDYGDYMFMSPTCPF